MNNCEYDIINNVQCTKKYVEYSFNNMEAYSSIGLERKKQEDGVLITYHNKNSDFRLIAIADGMGKQNGSLASNIVLYNMIKWFQSLSLSYYFENNCIFDSLIQSLYQIDRKIRDTCFFAGSTIALAIKCMANTYILNIGDTRVYLSNNCKLKQISIDHNIAWELYEKGKIDRKDNIRFHKNSNLLTARLGCEKQMLKICKNTINNNYYERIYIFSDGITDCISEEELEILTKDNTKRILLKALSSNSINYSLGKNYYNIINCGKDNASIAVLKK